MANWYVSSVAYAALSAWSASATLSFGDVRKPTAPATGSERVYRVSSITTGITGGTEPTWPLNANQTVVDGGVTWTECTGQDPTYPSPHVDVIYTQTNGRASISGDDWTFVDSAHTEPTWTSTRDWSRIGFSRVVTWSGLSVPPIPTDMAAGPVVLQTSGAANLVLAGVGDFDGFELRAGSGSSTASIIIGRASLSGRLKVRRGKLKLNNTSASTRVQLGNGSGGSLWLEGCPIEFGAAGQGISFSVTSAFFVWQNTPNAVQGTAPTTLFFNSVPNNWVLIENCDLSAVSGTIATVGTGALTFTGTFRVRRCKLHASVTKANNWRLRSPADALEFIACDDSTSNKMSKVHKATMSGELSTTYTEYRDNATADADGSKFSIKAVQSTSANGSPTRSFHNIIDLPERWNADTGASITASVEVAVEHTALLNRSLMWLEVIYLGDSASPVASSASSMTNDAPAGTPTAGTASSENWTAAARANSENPASGSIRSVSSNIGRLFIKQSGGAFNSSLPSGYATMVDGDTITDGSAVVRAMYRQTLSVSFTPQRAGPIGFRVHIAHPDANQKVVLVDPTVTLS